MSEFKKGDRVRLIKNYGSLKAGVVGTIRAASGTRAVVEWDTANTDRVARERNALNLDMLELITDPTPLRFEDVKTGDRITVESPDYTVTGTADVNTYRIAIKGMDLAFSRRNDGWHESTWDQLVQLTAHEPAEPEWHRAKVIKADTMTGGRLKNPIIQDLWLHKGVAFINNDGMLRSPDELTNVVIIVDEHGEVIR